MRLNRDRTDELVGQGAVWASLDRKITRWSRRTEPVLLLGQSGTGKTRLARELHVRGPRTGAFVPVDCTKLNTPMAQSELFGHKKGAFTGAFEDRPGAVRTAEGGTLFFDEIGELDTSAQALLLLLLDGQPFTPVGSDRPVAPNVRIVVATNRDLFEMARRGEFKGDLLARIKALTLTMPSLSQRPEDARAFARHEIARINRDLARCGHPGFDLRPEAIEAIGRLDWDRLRDDARAQEPMNIRDLRAVVVDATDRAEDARRGADDGPIPVLPEHLDPALNFAGEAANDPEASALPTSDCAVLAVVDRVVGRRGASSKAINKALDAAGYGPVDAGWLARHGYRRLMTAQGRPGRSYGPRRY